MTGTVTESAKPAWLQMAEHVTTLFPAGSLLPGEAMEVRCFHRGRFATRGFFRDHGTLIRAAMIWGKTLDTYIGVGTRRCPGGVPITGCAHKRGKGGKTHVGRVPPAWVEVDLGKPYTDEDAIIAALDVAHLNPDLLVASGGGIHAYFLFDHPVTDLGRVERLNRALVKRVGNDAAIDASRVLRVAGTTNHKYTPQRPAQIICRQVHDAVHA